jgi:2'-5' RNA ligase
MKDRIRAFIAVNIPNEIRDGLADMRRQLKRSGADARWVKPNNIHLTLRFLGNDVPVQIADAIGESLRDSLAPIERFGITVRGLGAFPNVAKPRVVWIGIEPLDGPLQELHGAVEDAVEKAGWPREDRPFNPHLTLGRIKSQSHVGKLRQTLEKEINAAIGHMVVDSVALIRSELTPNGPVYETLTTVALKPREQESC